MSRPRTPIGTFGEIEFTKLPNGTVRARTRFRDHDGVLRRIEASGDTRTRAEHRLGPTACCPATRWSAHSGFRVDARGLIV